MHRRGIGDCDESSLGQKLGGAVPRKFMSATCGVARWQPASEREQAMIGLGLQRIVQAVETWRAQDPELFSTVTPMSMRGVTAGEWFVRILTSIHALGSLVLIGMTAYLLFGGNQNDLARTPGARLMVDLLGPWLPPFLGSLAILLASIAWSSFRRRPWAWRAAVVAYTIGIIGSAWEVSVGISQAWLSVLINAGVVSLLLSRPTRRVFFAPQPCRN